MRVKKHKIFDRKSIEALIFNEKYPGFPKHRAW